MPREDPALLPAIPALTETITVSDPRIPGKSWDFLFSVTCEGSESDELFLFDRTRRLEAEYVGDNAKRIDTNGQYIPVERQLCMQIAMLMESEFFATGESWTFPEWVIWRHKAPNAFRQLGEKYQELFLRARPKAATADDSEEGSGPAEETPSKNA